MSHCYREPGPTSPLAGGSRFGVCGLLVTIDKADAGKGGVRARKPKETGVGVEKGVSRAG